MNRIHFWRHKLIRRASQIVGSRFYVNPPGDVNKSIFVAGTARSGTTWLGDLIASQIPCRILFEPFNPNLVPEYREFNYFQYMRPANNNAAFFHFAQKVFSGEIRNHWIDRQNEELLPKYRLIKEIRANLSLKWLHNNFPMVPIIFLMRHPCAVVLSRMELGWATDDDIQPFLLQPQLVADYLREHLEFIQRVRTEEEKHAIIWSISNLVPLTQFEPGELKIVYYENLCARPEFELPSVFTSIGQRYDAAALGKINRPSQTTRVASPVVSGNDRISHWKKKLSPRQIDIILQVVERFGLHHIYADSYLPLNKHLG